AIDGGQFVLDRELRDAAALAHQKSVPRHQEAIRPILRQLHERYLVDRGADLLLNAGRIGPGMADALKVEARRRAEVDHFYGLIVLASGVAGRPFWRGAPRLGSRFGSGTNGIAMPHLKRCVVLGPPESRGTLLALSQRGALRSRPARLG